ncbi:hypothetical protein CBR_g3739 [Chara braunii]|uniref:Uncharacterized protein n=1 Tax=Chara braunii TaxID=69332 RepID=A0A388KG72_CHABU|nr:hypothetical protein CBR_g3739 [Chara braunii]|eukprot:GBG69041.1 hypothetical protein CBR_g3739 [Chara braunii]
MIRTTTQTRGGRSTAARIPTLQVPNGPAKVCAMRNPGAKAPSGSEAQPIGSRASTAASSRTSTIQALSRAKSTAGTAGEATD